LSPDAIDKFLPIEINCLLTDKNSYATATMASITSETAGNMTTPTIQTDGIDKVGKNGRVATKIAPTHLKVVAQSSQNRSPDPFRLDYASMTPAVKGFGRTYAPPSEDKKIRNDCSSAIPVGAQGSGHISAEANVTQNVSPETRRSSIRHFAGIPPGARNREFLPKQGSEENGSQDANPS